jgi:hypothetical protein
MLGKEGEGTVPKHLGKEQWGRGRLGWRKNKDGIAYH